ncbi:MAG: radical SAM protein [Candidatus Nealsonbacteria bacterium]|nr:MAG: radical SAM protein [Candidatus Nealsonbacteria bacterium]
MKKILLLNLPGDEIYLRDYYCSFISEGDFVWHPVDLTVLSGILSSDYQIKVIDAIADRIKFDECCKKISSMDIDTIIFLSGAVSWEKDKEFLKKIKRVKQIKLIGTGDLFLFQGEKILRENKFLDALILDFTDSEILKFLSAGKGLFKNIIYRDREQIVIPKKITKKNKIFSLPLPRLDLFPMAKYDFPIARHFPFATVVASLHCPYHCRFCIYNSLEFKWRDADNVIEELKYIYSLGIKEVRFRDNTFGANRNQALDICRKMLLNNFNFSWSCSSRVDVLDEELLEIMKKSGCHIIQLGVESGNQGTLDCYNKQFTLNQVRKMFSLCQKLGIRTMAHFILGLPGEDEEAILNTLKFAVELNCDFVTFNIAAPRIGTDLRKNAISKGWLIDNTLKCSDSSRTYPAIETEELSRKKLWELRNKAIRRFYLRPSYIIKRIFSLKSLYELKMDIREGLLYLISSFKRGL